MCSTSILNLVAISLERCLSVKFPAIHRNLSRKMIHAAVAFVWCYGVFASGALLNAYTCLHREPWHALYLSLMSFFLPLLIIIVAYIFIFKIAISRQRRHGGSIAREFRISHHCGRHRRLCVRLDAVLHSLHHFCIQARDSDKLESRAGRRQVAAVLKFGREPHHLHLRQPGLSTCLPQVVAY